MRKLALNDFKSYQFLSNLRYSPSGECSVLVATRANKDNSYDAHLYLYRNNEAIRLTSTGNEKLFVWDSEDSILFASSRNKGVQEKREKGMDVTSFYRISTSGGEAVEAFTLTLNVSAIEKVDEDLYLVTAAVPVERKVFEPYNPEDTCEAAQKKKKEQEAWQIVDEVPFWFNGRGFTNKLRTRLFLYDSKADTLTPISDAEVNVSLSRVAPCQKYIAYAANNFEDGVLDLMDDVYVYDIEAKVTDKFISGRLNISNMDYWEEKLVIAGTEAKKHGRNENPCFYFLSCITGELTYFADYDNWIGMPVGSDSRLGGGRTYKVVEDMLYFQSSAVNNADIFSLNLRSAEIKRITGGTGSFDFFDISPKGMQAVAFLDDRLQELYQVDGEKYQRLTSFNEAIHTEIIYSKPEHHTFTDPDGFEIDGWVIPPVGYEKGKQYPAILHIHGGPKTIQGDVYFHEMQLWAAEGYFVLFSNPRGSDGKGNVFADIRGKYGTCDYDNLMQFTDEMLKAYPDIDADRLGVTGGSYGGFMTNWIIGHTNRFKAAASQRSISNWISKQNTTDIGFFFVPDQQQATTWGDVEKLWWHSPLKYADKCTTPTLFIHSDCDFRCWVAEGYQMFTALRLHGVEARMCVFHGENHELSRSGKPEGRQKRMEEILSWMDQYLK